MSAPAMPGDSPQDASAAAKPGDSPLTYGTREPNEICYYPRSNEIGFFGVGLIGGIEKLGYWDGEPPA